MTNLNIDTILPENWDEWPTNAKIEYVDKVLNNREVMNDIRTLGEFESIQDGSAFFKRERVKLLLKLRGEL